jgi:hypothetical protein
MQLNTVIKLPDGRVGTICYHNLDGRGGVWGVHEFEMPPGGFGDGLPPPQFMLRERGVEASLRRDYGPDLECVGEEFEVVEVPDSEVT